MENKSLAEIRTQEKDAVISSTITDTWEEPTLFKNPNKLEQYQNKAKHNAFDIDFEESKQISTPNDTCDTSVGKFDPFLKKKQAKCNAFDINFEDSKEILTPEDTNTGNLSKTRKQNPFENKKQAKDNAFDIDFEESKQISTPCDTSDTNEQNLSKIKKRKIPFENKKQTKNNAFDIDFEESKQISTPNDTSDTSMGNSTRNGKFDPFLKKKQKKCNAFDINFEDSKQVLTPEDTNTENLSKTRNLNPFETKKQAKHNAFDIDLEESKQISTPNDTDTCDTSVGNSTRNGKFDPFLKKKQAKCNAFDINFEDSKQILTPEDTNTGNLSKTRNLNPFQNKIQAKHNAFDIDFEESKQISTPNDTSDPSVENSTRNGKFDPFLKKKQAKCNAFDINFEDSKQILTPEDTSTRNLSKTRNLNPFENKKQAKHNAFDIDLEESKQLSTPNDTTDTNEQNSIIGKWKVPFQNKEQTKHNGFDVDCEEFTAITTPSLKNITPFRPSEKKVNGEAFDVNFDKSNLTSNLSSVRAAENSFKAKSNDINESIQIPHDKSFEENNSGLDVSSFNDENLNNWISDHSEDETNYKEILDESSEEKSFPVSPPKNNEATLTSDEDLERQFKLKLNAIIDEAKRGKVENSTVIVPEAKRPEKPNKFNRDKENKSSRQKPRLAKPAPFVNKRLYNHLTKKIKPKYGIDSVIKAEEMIKSICEAVKVVTRRKNYQKKVVNDLKVEMAKHGIIETTNDFYIFVRSFLPDDFREKVIPCLQPGTNIVFPPKDPKNPFEKILNK